MTCLHLPVLDVWMISCMGCIARHKCRVASDVAVVVTVAEKRHSTGFSESISGAGIHCRIIGGSWMFGMGKLWLDACKMVTADDGILRWRGVAKYLLDRAYPKQLTTN